MGCNCSLKCLLKCLLSSLPLSSSPSFSLSLSPSFSLSFPFFLHLSASLPLFLLSPFRLALCSLLGSASFFPFSHPLATLRSCFLLRMLLLKKIVLCPHSLPQFCWIKFSVVYHLDHFWPIFWTHWLNWTSLAHQPVWQKFQSWVNPMVYIICMCACGTLGKNHTSVIGTTMNSSSLVSNLHSALNMWLPYSVHTPFLHIS